MRKAVFIMLAIIVAFIGEALGDSIFATGGIGLAVPRPDGRSASMGVLGIGLADTTSVGSLNPALWAGTNLTRFSSGVEIIRYNSRDLQDSDLTDQFVLPFTALGICLKPGLTLGFRFSPYTRMDTRLVEIITLPPNDEYSVEEIYLLKGGVSLGSTILAVRLSEKIWAGAAVDLIFGSIYNIWRLNFFSGGGAYGTYTGSDALDSEFRLEQNLMGIRPRGGIYLPIGKVYSLGVFAAPPVKIDVEEKLEYWGVDSSRVIKSEMEFPAELGFGFCFPVRERVIGVFDFLWTGWKGDEQVIGNPAGYHESQTFALGVEFEPLTDPLESWLKRTYYRTGINFSNLYYQVPAGKTVLEYSLNLGAGLPVPAGYGRMDLNFTLGKRGELNINGADETFFKFGVYISTGERWFLRKKKY